MPPISTRLTLKFTIILKRKSQSVNLFHPILEFLKYNQYRGEKMNLEYKKIPITKENIKLLETLRFDAYQISPTIYPIENSYYFHHLNDKQYLILGAFKENNLVAACYITNTHQSLYIDQLFVKKEFQRKKIGTQFLNDILKQKNMIENHFQTKFNYSYLDNAKNTKSFYESIGYQEKNQFMRKHL